MRKPKMILFDYGHTLASELSFDAARGNAELLKYATKNPNNYTAKDVGHFADELFSNSIITKARELNVETHNFMFTNLLYGIMQIEFSLSSQEMERIFWDNAAPATIMPNIDKLLEYLDKENIRTGVISNISFSGGNLKNRIDTLIPNNNFEFVIASSEYIIRKPDSLIFKLAISKANLSPEDMWYCGDNTYCDCYGANNVGIFPVWYHSNVPCDYRDKKLDVRPNYEHIYIKDWLDMIDVLEGLSWQK